MQVVETKSEGLTREYKITLPATEIEEKITHRLKEIGRTAQLPGFRPGKVPVTMLRKRFGGSVMGEIVEKAIGDSSQQALTERGVRPAMQPQIEITSFEDGADLEYTMAVDTLPDIETGDFSKIKLERLIPEPDQAAIDAALDNIAGANKTSTPITKKRKSESGDIIIIDFVGSVDGEEFPGGKADAYSLELGSGSFIPGFEEQLIDVSAGDDVEVKVAFPEAYGAAELAGKDAVFKVAVKEIHEATPAAIDDELAKGVGMESLDKLKEAISEEQGREYGNLAKVRLKRFLLDQLNELHQFEVPARMVDGEFETIWSQFEKSKAEAAEKGEEMPQELDDDEQKSEFREIAERRVRLGLLLAEVGRQNNIQVSQDDINRGIMEEARQYQGQEQMVIDYYKKNPEAIEQITAPLYEEKVVDFIIELASVTDKKVTTEELFKILEAENEADDKKAKPKAKAAPKKAAAKKKAPAKKKPAVKSKADDA